MDGRGIERVVLEERLRLAMPAIIPEPPADAPVLAIALRNPVPDTGADAEFKEAVQIGQVA